MQNTAVKLGKKNNNSFFEKNITLIGWIASIAKSGRVFVDFPGNTQGPLAAHSIINISEENINKEDNPTSVLLAFGNEDHSKPIILGFINECFIEPKSPNVQSNNIETYFDENKLVIESNREIVLRCGQSSVTLSADGKIVIKGKRIVSRASEANKVKGSCVSIN